MLEERYVTLFYVVVTSQLAPIFKQRLCHMASPFVDRAVWFAVRCGDFLTKTLVFGWRPRLATKGCRVGGYVIVRFCLIMARCSLFIKA
jgi:hypothetical protein